MRELAVQARRSHLNLIPGTVKAWPGEKTTMNSNDIKVVNFNF